MKAPHSFLGPAPTSSSRSHNGKVLEHSKRQRGRDEITLYGDVAGQRPIDWWTGEPPARPLYHAGGLHTEDLAAVKRT